MLLQASKFLVCIGSICCDIFVTAAGRSWKETHYVAYGPLLRLKLVRIFRLTQFARSRLRKLPRLANDDRYLAALMTILTSERC